jgi:hypothetical protein
MSSILAHQYIRAHLRRAGGSGGGASASEYSCAYGAQINFGDLAPYLTIYDYRYTKESLNIFHSNSCSIVPHAGPKNLKKLLRYSSCLLIIWTLDSHSFV